ncbi:BRASSINOSTEROID INSENSITIVE 1-associated receptor kinase 1-like [Syzygium oleosum]|uniref:BRASSINOSTEROID INSENSITIVE 1-associated receptor kinase 1-like n=1 Tax=Syzygium oleosum TaxID=219896 RepID=UPI0024B92B3E|nr:BRASSINOSTEROID INSENSITIVE 1-associated receptor kinase 1-like [Syzygium oleosum]
MVFNLRTFSLSSPSIEVGSTARFRELLRRFSVYELRVATGNFSPNSMLGEGAFGPVYRGCLADGSIVAIKRMRELSEHSLKQFWTEVEVAGIAPHPNLLSLVGFCDTEQERLLVYPFMVNKSLNFHLGRRVIHPIDWSIRMRIALGVARGLAHLHDQCHPSIIHRDVSCSNTLLNEEFEPVLGDLGLTRIMHETDIVVGNVEWSMDCRPVKWSIDRRPVEWSPRHRRCISPQRYHDTYVNSAVRAHTGYVAPEYLTTGKCTWRVDVYAYGYILLELITGKQLSDNGIGGLHPVDLMSELVEDNSLETIIDSKLQGSYSKDEAECVLQLALLCVCMNPAKRPKMSDVVSTLENSCHDKRIPGEVDSQLDFDWNLCETKCSTPYYSILPSPSSSETA